MGTGAGGKKQKKKYCIKSSIGHLSCLLDRPSILYPLHQTSPISIPSRIKEMAQCSPRLGLIPPPFPFLSFPMLSIYLGYLGFLHKKRNLQATKENTKRQNNVDNDNINPASVDIWMNRNSGGGIGEQGRRYKGRG